jgi:hypothetical protein
MTKGLPWKALAEGTLTHKQRRTLARAACKDFKVFAKLCGPPEWAFGAPNSGHDKIADAACCEDRGPDGKIRIHIEAPRTGGKSALAGQRHAAWRLVRSAFSWKDEPYKDGSITILYACETASKSEEAGTFVRDLLSEENDVTTVFGVLIEPGASIKGFNLVARTSPNPQKSWSVGSPKKSTQGHHPHLIYVDDVETNESTSTPKKMERTASWFEELQAQVNDRGEIRVMGTREHADDIYGKLVERAETWKVFIFTVEDSMFPNLTPEALAVLRSSEMTLKKFSKSYLNDPWPDEMKLFRSKYFKLVRLTEKIKNLPKYMLVDMAGSEDAEACETVIWIVSKDAADTLYCIDLIHGRWEPSLIMRKMIGMFERWNVRWFALENRVITKWALPLVRAAEREYGVVLPHRTATAKSYVSKTHHIESLEPRFRNSKIVFCDSIPKTDIHIKTIGTKEIVSGAVHEAFVKFPRGKLKDIPDALAYADCYDDEGAPLVPKPRTNDYKVFTEKPSSNPWKFGSFRGNGQEGWRNGRRARDELGTGWSVRPGEVGFRSGPR